MFERAVKVVYNITIMKQGRVKAMYNFKEVEAKWQKKWYTEGTFNAKQDFSIKKKWYGLIEFPYPSGQGLHVGHPRSYTALDIIARKKRMQGYNVLYPIGFDAFGLPAENYAIKNHVHPKITTEKNIAHFTEQLKALGFSFDWDRVVNTTDPNYYKWTQWIFIQLYKKGLAYKATMPINFCTGCKVGLANEEVVNGVCERCGSPVVQKEKSQWMLKITEYAQRLIDDLDDLDFLEKIKIQQKNWIGRSEGAEVDFTIKAEGKADSKLRIYTTRPDTMFGATYMVIAPEHSLIEEYKDEIENLDEVMDYKNKAALKSDFERGELNKDKTGVEIKGVTAVNPFTGEEIPIWIADYVLISYGTGAIMAVPAHDTRDFEFATKFNLPIIPVIRPKDGVLPEPMEEAYVDTENGIAINSGFLNGLLTEDAINKAIEYVEEKKIGERKVNYKLRDWVFSRQRYWGEPIPMVHCEKCGWNPIDESELPLKLPEIEDYEPGENGESPLAKQEAWIKTKCPVCGGEARRETDTMPQWAGSSWYFLRYMDPHNNKEFASMKKMKYWNRVDWYNGGMEHTARHLLYARFWVQFLYNIGLVPNKEMIWTRVSHGMILGSNGEKMSKSKGNVVNPDEIVNAYGADTLRVYEMFIGDYTQDAPWNTDSLKGCDRFLRKIERLGEKVVDKTGYSQEVLMNKTIKKVTDDNLSMKYNTAISALMILVNELEKQDEITKDDYRTLLILLNPDAPHITEELNEKYNLGKPICESTWPDYDEEKIVDDAITIGVQVNGKVRASIDLVKDEDDESVKAKAMKLENVIKFTEGKEIVKTIVIKNKIINIVVK